MEFLTKQGTHNNPVLKVVFAVLIIVFPVIAFAFGIQYQQSLINLQQPPTVPSPVDAPAIASKISPADVLPIQPKDLKQGWQTYEDKQTGFSFQYPPTVVIGTDKNNDKFQLGIHVRDLSNYVDEPMGFDKKNAEDDQRLLASGQYGMKLGMSFQPSEKVIKIGSTNGKVYSTFGGMDICTVVFSRSLVLYLNNKQILITLSAPENRIIKESPQLFKTDNENCGGQLVWSNLAGFHSDLSQHKGNPIAQSWYDSFDDIVNSFKITGQ